MWRKLFVVEFNYCPLESTHKKEQVLWTTTSPSLLSAVSIVWPPICHSLGDIGWTTIYSLLYDLIHYFRLRYSRTARPLPMSSVSGPQLSTKSEFNHSKHYYTRRKCPPSFLLTFSHHDSTGDQCQVGNNTGALNSGYTQVRFLI